MNFSIKKSGKISRKTEEEEYIETIYPWVVQYDKTYEREFFYNPITQESEWALPEAIQIKVTEFYTRKQKEKEEEEKRNVDEFLTPQQMQKPVEIDYMKRPAPKQVEERLSSKVAYRQGDEEYNIWYDKFLTTNAIKEREAKLTRCDPEKHSGFTKGDLYHTGHGYFCVFFARGCCSEGGACNYFHHLPSLEEAKQIDHSRDIFGRARFAAHRADRSGVGSFMQESRTLRIGEFKMNRKAMDPDAEMYEVLWRHFCLWGEIEDLLLLPGKGEAFVRYKHRCIAEFAKEAMSDQSLDRDEVIYVKWSKEDDEAEQMVNAEESMKREELEEKEKAIQERRNKRIKQAAEELEIEKERMKENPVSKDQDEIDKKVEEAENNVMNMMKVLREIDDARAKEKEESQGEVLNVLEFFAQQDSREGGSKEKTYLEKRQRFEAFENNEPLV